MAANKAAAMIIEDNQRPPAHEAIRGMMYKANVQSTFFPVKTKQHANAADKKSSAEPLPSRDRKCIAKQASA
jgi:hypothetical protein